jgi:hypothetical protein
MSLKDAVAFCADFAKFIQTLWAAYIALIVTMIGWLLTLRGSPATTQANTREILVGAFVLVTVIFGFVLQQNNMRLINMMRLVDAIAPIEGRKAGHPEQIYRETFRTGWTPIALHGTTLSLVPIAFIVSIFICSLTK